MPARIEELVGLLDLEEIEIGLFRGRQPRTAQQRAFGGQVLAQALTAATHTAPPDRPVHSLHAYFLVEGRTDAPIIYDVETVRDGGSFSSRRVVARQHGRIIFTMSASFHVHEDGFEHHDRPPDAVPTPEECPRMSEVLADATGRPAGLWDQEWGALDVRYVGDSRPDGVIAADDHPARARVWIRTDGEVPADPAVNRALLAYASDLTLLGAALVPHGSTLGSPGLQAASLDHAMWFHRPVRADRWLLYEQVSPSASSALGLATGQLFDGDTLVASVAQEGLIRKVSSR